MPDVENRVEEDTDSGQATLPLGNPEGALLGPLLDRPKSVALVALGHSCQAFLQETCSKGYYEKAFDEVWTLNRGVRGISHDKLFCMDDLRWLEQRDPAYADFIRRHDKPVFTSTAYGDYLSAVEYPFQQVAEHWQDTIFAVNTVAYAVAYAGYIGVESLSVYGADFVYPNGNTAEKGGQAVSYMLALCHERGMKFRIPQTSTLLYSNETKAHPDGTLRREYYGYHRKAEMEQQKEAK